MFSINEKLKRTMKKSKEEKNELLRKEKERLELYKEKEKQELARIKAISDKHERHKQYFIFKAKQPINWIFDNIKDWHTAIIFMIVFLVVSCEVWIPYLLAILSWGTTFSKTMIGVGSAMWSFWLLPGTPFILICISLTMLIKGIFNKIRFKNIK